MDFFQLAMYCEEAVKGTDFDFTDLSLTVTPGLLVYPFSAHLSRTDSLSVIITGVVSQGSNSFPVSVAVKLASEDSSVWESDFSVWCGDVLLEGRIAPKALETRVNNAVAPLLISFSQKSQLIADMKALNGIHPRVTTRCDFWARWARESKLCNHTAFFLKNLMESNPTFASEMEMQLFKILGGSSSEAAHSPSAIAKDGFNLNTLAFKVPVLIEGDRGAGKTYAARTFAKSNEFPLVECAGHEGIESIDLLGHLIPIENNTLIWKDGPISEAFRKAQATKVVLIIDELLRIPIRQLSLLLTVLTPDQGYYQLRTGRIINIIDGVASEETLRVPIENLCIVATTNVGAEFAVDEIDPALAERFVPIRKDSTASELKAILNNIAKSKGISLSKVTQAVSFFKKMAELHSCGQLAHTPTTRTIVRAFELANFENEIPKALLAQRLLWVARSSDGRPIQVQLDSVEVLINSLF